MEAIGQYKKAYVWLDMIELRDVWTRRGGAMIAEGDAAPINYLLAKKLTKIRVHPLDGG